MDRRRGRLRSPEGSGISATEHVDRNEPEPRLHHAREATRWCSASGQRAGGYGGQGILHPGLDPSTAPIAEFSGSPTLGFAPLSVAFTDLSASGGATINSWSWDFGDSGTSTAQNPSHTFAAPGTYTVSLTATNVVGPGSTTKTSYITVAPTPVPATAQFSATPTSGDAPLTVQFTDGSTAGTSPITGRLWDFGDGITSTETNPSHVYTTPGSYTVVLNVTSRAEMIRRTRRSTSRSRPSDGADREFLGGSDDRCRAASRQLHRPVHQRWREHHLLVLGLRRRERLDRDESEPHVHGARNVHGFFDRNQRGGSRQRDENELHRRRSESDSADSTVLGDADERRRAPHGPVHR